ncbi:MAG: ABC transporter ATP-binding protein [Thermoprotei archaeon]|nr:MAG: ABC transporter ATP-binding protein [Thermoprotei archaeon]
MSLLITDGLFKRFGGVIALDNVSIRVEPSSITLLVGPNGSGKSTLINVISGFYKPDSGRVFFNNCEVTGWPPHKLYSAGIARTFQLPAPFAKMTVLENLLVAAKWSTGESPLTALLHRRRWLKEEAEHVERAFRILELLSLRHMWDRRASELSGGQLKLLELGRVLMSSPKLILLDEPLAGINPRLAEAIVKHISSLRDELGVAFLIVEHRLDVIADYADYAYAMFRGRVIEEGTPKQVLKSPQVLKAYLGG